MDTYLVPNLTLKEVRAQSFEAHVDPLRDFSEACREELQIFAKDLTPVGGDHIARSLSQR
jgi:hypothetical protein